MGTARLLLTALAVFALLGPSQGAARTLAGAYLAATQAEASNDHAAAARYYLRALGHDPDNATLLDAAARALASQGDVSAAITIARRLDGLEPENAVSTLLLLGDEIAQGRLTVALERLDATGGSLLPVTRDLWRGWLLVAMGDEEEGFALFDAMGTNRSLGIFGRYHQGLAQATVGNLDEAVALLADHPDGPVRLNDGATRARIELLAQVGRGEEARDSLSRLLSSGLGDSDLAALDAEIAQGGPVALSVVKSPLDGFARALADVAGVFGPDNDAAALIYARLAGYLDPDLAEAHLIAAEILERQGQTDLALAAYRAVPTETGAGVRAALGQAIVLQSEERDDEAVALLQELARRLPEVLRVQFSLAEALRITERFEEAVTVYDRAVVLADAQDRRFWQLYYGRGIANHNIDDWAAAEEDFRTALSLDPDQPFVLNYLGYSLVERNSKLEEALDMIERAVEQRPENGFIVDSLGWVFYTLGRYEEAVEPMERAVALQPADPVINDHLGDVYWQVGRVREAEFQWLRALTFDPDAELRARIDAKLERGLDAVLAEEAGTNLSEEARNAN